MDGLKRIRGIERMKRQKSPKANGSVTVNCWVGGM